MSVWLLGCLLGCRQLPILANLSDFENSKTRNACQNILSVIDFFTTPTSASAEDYIQFKTSFHRISWRICQTNLWGQRCISKLFLVYFHTLSWPQNGQDLDDLGNLDAFWAIFTFLTFLRKNSVAESDTEWHNDGNIPSRSVNIPVVVIADIAHI